MKRISLFLIAIFVLTTSCQKKEVKTFEGEYFFKTGGYVEISGKATKSDDETSVDTVFTRFLPNEIGQMLIVQSNPGVYKVTMNVIGSAPIVFDATADGDNMTLAPAERDILVYPSVSMILPDTRMRLSMGGDGCLYNDMIIFNLNVTGKYDHSFLKGEITKSSVTCIAEK